MRRWFIRHDPATGEIDQFAHGDGDHITKHVIPLHARDGFVWREATGAAEDLDPTLVSNNIREIAENPYATRLSELVRFEGGRFVTK